MNDGQALSILPWIPEPLTYFDTLELVIIEGDAIDRDDRTSILIPGVVRIPGSNILYSKNDGCYNISTTVVRYENNWMLIRVFSAVRLPYQIGLVTNQVTDTLGILGNICLIKTKKAT